jgi:aspartate aminotransferase-like enzyme
MQVYNVLAPGPVNLHPDVEKALALPMIHHRTPEFDAILKRVLTRLKMVFETAQPCYALTSTGSGGMECLLVNTLNPGDEVLAIESGKFGERWADMVEVFGGKLHRLKVDWGKAVDPALVERALSANPKIRMVLCQACETSTGVMHPIEALAKIVGTRPDTLFLVDAITALGAFRLPMDAWGIDGIVGGSQKALMLPTGLSVLSFSQKAWARIENNPTPRYYFDLRRERAANEKGETFFSSNVTLMRALDVVLGMIEKQGLPELFRTIRQRADFTRKFALALGFSLYAESPSDSVTALRVPDGIDSQKLRQLLEQRFLTTVMGGQDQAKGKIIRIGHMGYIQPEQMIKLMLDLNVCLGMLQPTLLKDVEDLQTQMQKFWD